MPRRKRFKSCPSEDCKAANPRQYDLKREQLAKAGVEGDWLSHARRCGYCGCVYSLDYSNGAPPQRIIRGYFDKELMLPGHWKPIWQPW